MLVLYAARVHSNIYNNNNNNNSIYIIVYYVYCILHVYYIYVRYVLSLQSPYVLYDDVILRHKTWRLTIPETAVYIGAY